MRPYLAIISDSFRAAFASRVLWLVLAGILVLLLALAPIGYREVYRVELEASDVNSAERLTALLAESLRDDTPSAARRVAMELPPEMREEILRAAETAEDVPRRSRYADAFNALMDSDAWYEPELWEELRFGELSELEEMSDGSMNEMLRARRNRLRLEVAFPGAFRARPERSIQITYAMFELPGELPIRRQQFIDLVNTTFLPTILSNLVGIAAVFIGILVTAPIIPDMLQPGALHLLLSKPISRPALYLSKFIGGCAFVLLCETLLVTGLWLIAGTRFDIWNHRLFYCIPVFVFLFAVYYSVSALAALRWRSAIVSVVFTILFWMGCFIVGLAGDLFDGLVTQPARVRDLAAAEGVVFTAIAAGELNRIGPDDAAYETVIGGQFGRQMRVLGPIRTSDGRIVAAQADVDPFNPFSAADASLRVFDDANQWTAQLGIRLPRATTGILPVAGGIVATTSSGLWYAPNAQLTVEPEEESDQPPRKGGLLAGITQLLRGDAAEFTDILPPGVAVSTPNAVAVAAPTDDLVVYSAGTLYWLDKDASGLSWSLGSRISIDGDNSLPAWIAASANHVVLARADEPMRIFRGGDLHSLGEIPLEGESIDELMATPDGRSLLAETVDGSLWRFDMANPPTWHRPSYPHQGSIEAVGWGDDGRMWLAHDIDRLTAVDPATGEINGARYPDRDKWRNINAFIMTPLRTVVPQTGEIQETVVALIIGSRSYAIELPGQTERVQLDIARPLATCAGFTAVMLLIGCLYIHRQDF